MALCLSVKPLFRKEQGVRTPSVDDLARTEAQILKLLQRENFAQEIQDLSSERECVQMQSALAKLDPFLDSDGILRVGGRLRHSDLPYTAKHPALLPKGNPISTAILQFCQEQMAHQGRSTTVNEARPTRFWVVGASQAVGKIVSRCVRCRRKRREVSVQKMADLPNDRVEAAPPFTNTGVDFFGPFFIKEGRKELKCWGCIFTCLTCRAVHLETAPSLSSDCFLNVLRRFIAIRGAVARLWSDRGTNFVGANNELRTALEEINKGAIHDYLADRGCEFICKVPHASHMGGVWERPIRTARSILSTLLRGFGKQLDDDSLRTLMYETAAVVNSRPLTAENVNDPATLSPITPNHLLTMKSKVIVPPPGDFQWPDIYSRKRWRRVQYLTNVFWARWRKEYLQHIQQWQKWLWPTRNYMQGDVVLLKDIDLPRSHWRLGRVIRPNLDSDGQMRTVRGALGHPLLEREGKRRQPLSEFDCPISQLVLLVEAESDTDLQFVEEWWP